MRTVQQGAQHQIQFEVAHGSEAHQKTNPIRMHSSKLPFSFHDPIQSDRPSMEYPRHRNGR